ncbi:MAG: molybdopterin-dependent oxidoreductase [Chloroflexi bacterium]|nr:molybdopterin-dependent oxidoreductase [Chloroflexota bacterium]
MDTVTITLDGREVSGRHGMTVLELAREVGVDIPTLCHDPNLKPVGACRICLVEDERSGALLASCVAPIAPGMVINTASPRVLERRKVIIELMLASHPDACFICDKGNRCELRHVASDLGVGLLRFQRIPQSATIQEVNPFIERDLSKCILCAKCIRVDQELVVEGAIDYMDRGFASRPTTLDDVPLERSECTFCGTCVAVCPTGALMEKEKPYRSTTASTVQTICTFCGCGCAIDLEVRDDRIVRARPGDSPVNRGALCVKGSYGYDFVHSPERLTKPLIKTDAGFAETSWEEALDTVAGNFQQIREAGGPASLAVLASSKCTNEENYLLQRFARSILGTNNIDNGSRAYGGCVDCGFGSLDDLERSDVIMVIGADPPSSAPVAGYAIKRAVKYQGARLVLIDPRETKLASFAHLWMRPRVGSDLALVNDFARIVLEDRLSKRESATTENFEAFKASLRRYCASCVEEITGVDHREVRQAAWLLASAKRASILYGNGITQYPAGSGCVAALSNLALLMDNVSAFMGLQRDGNGRGACDMGALPGFLPGRQCVEDIEARKKFSERWGSSVPAMPGLTASDVLAKPGAVKGMWIVGENPVRSFPRANSVREALACLDFLVVQDMFLTETVRLAQVVLPAASHAEKEGTLTNFEGRAQQLRKAIEPVGSSLPDWEIILRLAARMGRPMPFNSPQEVSKEIKELLPSHRIGALQSSEKGTPCFVPVRSLPEPLASKGDYPLLLLTGTTLYRFGAGSRSSRSSRLTRFQPEAFIEVAEADAAVLGLFSGDKVKIFSSTGEVAARIEVTTALPQGMLFMPVSAPVSGLLDGGKACAVRLERIGSDE